MNVPKIIHQIAPKDKSKWHPLWERCYNSWRKQFPDFTFMLWNDEEDIDNLIKFNYPEYFDIYKRFPFRMMNIDMAKNAIVHTNGGIFCDMDQFCYENFWDMIVKDACLLEDAGNYEDLVFPTGDTEIENSILISAPGHPLFKKILDSIIEKFLYCEEIGWTDQNLKFSIMQTSKIKNATYNARLVEEVTGSYLIAGVYNDMINKSSVQILSKENFTNIYSFKFEKSFKTIHIYTKYWGQESIKYMEETDFIDKSLPMDKKLLEYFLLGYGDKEYVLKLLNKMLDHDTRENTPNSA
jgi:flavodoxin